ncbi:MAG: ribosome small subunit-dependent GTPase A [Dehalococcoidales bacterium]|nr:ribosome small subunit-dependent GTPase A [Dehalococcoidales bacterium]
MTEQFPESLVRLGWDSFFETHYNDNKVPGGIPCRVTSEFKNSYRIIGNDGEFPATLSGRLLYNLTGGYPAVGDWVVAVPFPDGEQAIIHAVLPRKSSFSRMAAGKFEEQVAAANIDTAFLVTALDGSNYNLRRIERYLTLAWRSGASPVLVLNKADLCDDVDTYLREAESIGMGVPVYAVSAIERTGLDNLKEHLQTGQTVVFLGSSGVGKSAIINALLGQELQETGEIRAFDNKGRHTTTRRELIVLPDGGMVIDTPGMRVIGLWGSKDDLQESFEDIEMLAAGCRFVDCRHDSEPGCAVKEALKTGELDAGRYRNYQKLQKELHFVAMKEDVFLRQEEQQLWKRRSKFGKQLKKQKYKGR